MYVYQNLAENESLHLKVKHFLHMQFYFLLNQNNILRLFVLGPMAIAWNLSGFAFIKFLENQSIKLMLSFSRVLTTVFILVSE